MKELSKLDNRSFILNHVLRIHFKPQLMRNLLVIFFISNCICSLPGMELVEKFRSVPGVRMPNLVFEDYSIKDINNNGTVDILAFWKEPEGLKTPIVYDGGTKEIIGDWNGDGIDDIGFQSSEVNVLDFNFYTFTATDDLWNVYRFSQTEPAQATTFGFVTHRVGTSEYAACHGALIIAITDVDADELPDIIYRDLETKQLVVLGAENSNTSNMVYQTRNQSRSNFQLEKKFESEKGIKLLLSRGEMSLKGLADVNNDGNDELITIVEDSNQVARGIGVLNVNTKEFIWQFGFPDPVSDFSPFHGFYDVDGLNGKEAYFGDRIVVNLDKEIFRLPEMFKIVGLSDFDSDGLADILGYQLKDSVIQIWGVATETTPITAASLEQSGFSLKQNFPNPFTKETTIKYKLEKSGHVQLIVYDQTGRNLKTLVNQYQIPGSYAVPWGSLEQKVHIFTVYG